MPPPWRYMELAQSDLHMKTVLGWELWEFNWAVGIHCLHLGALSHRRRWQGRNSSITAPTTKKKGRGAELVGGEVKWGEGCTERGEKDIVCLWLWATEKHELSGHVWVCLESVFVCGHVLMSGLDWVWVRGFGHVCVRRLQFGMLEPGGHSKDAQTKLDSPHLLSFLNGDWGLAGFLYSCCLAQLCFRVSGVHVSFKPPKLPVTQDWLRESLVLDFCWSMIEGATWHWMSCDWGIFFNYSNQVKNTSAAGNEISQ